jgi:hypothetical protein
MCYPTEYTVRCENELCKMHKLYRSCFNRINKSVCNSSFILNFHYVLTKCVGENFALKFCRKIHY